MAKRYMHFENLDVWRESMSLCVDIHGELRSCKDFELRDQIQKSAISIPSNIAEGYERQTDKEFIRFLYIAKSSAGELRTQLLLATDISIIGKDVGMELIEKAKMISGMLQNLITARKKLLAAPTNNNAP